VLCDNLSVHKHLGVPQLIAAAGCQVRFLPPYSPDVSPIEHAFSTRTTRWRQANARTRPALETAIADGVQTITTRDAQAWFRHCRSALSEQLL
jgi:transposase